MEQTVYMDAYREMIENIREGRRQLSEKYNHDPVEYIEYLKSLDVKYSKQIRAFEKLSRVDQVAPSFE